MFADPRPLFWIMGVVILGLAAWVTTVLVRPGPRWAAPGAPDAPDAPDGPDEPAAMPSKASPPEEPRA